MMNDSLIEEMKEYALRNDVPIMEDDALCFLGQFLAEHNIKSLLEIGTAIGYSSIFLAKDNPELSIVTLEIDDERSTLAEKNITEAMMENRITVIKGDARKYSTREQFDAILLDGPKAHNSQLKKRFEGNLKKGGYLIVDDVYFHGLVNHLELVRTRRLRTLVRKIGEFNEELLNDPGYETTYIEIGDGLMTARKR